MFTFLLSLNLIMTILFVSMKHPLSMGLTLLIQTITISMITGNLTSNYWFSYILFLIMIGGMLVLFLYMTSIASNEKFSNNLKMMFLIIILPLSVTFITDKINFYYLTNESTAFKNNMIMNQSFNKFINMPMSLFLIFLIMFLFITLIATVKITNFKQGTIREMN